MDENARNFEIYMGSTLDLVVHVEYVDFAPANYVFRNPNFPDQEYRISTDLQPGHVGTFFGVNVTYDEVANQFTFVATQSPPPRQERQNNYVAESTVPHSEISSFVFDTIREEMTSIIYFVAIGVTCFLVLKFSIRKIKKNRNKKIWDEKYKKVKEDARQARIDRGWLPDKFN